MFLLLGFGLPSAAAANAPSVFETQIRPVLKQFCLECHSTEKQKGDLDLEVFSTLEVVKRHPKVWQNVAEQLANNEMPPKEKPQPSAAEKERLTTWVRTVLEELALEHAGDPGPVVLRRLSNAEYTYTTRDLTGIGSLDPAREFPVDGAAGEGFTNTGQALVISPSLFTKYLDAGKAIASHAVLLPEGIRFSAQTTRRDWTEEILGQIRSFYRAYTDPGGSDKVNLQGIVFETNEGGRLPLEKYLAATLEARDALANGSKSADAVAREHGLAAKYLSALWHMLAGREPSLLLEDLCVRWRMAHPGEAAGLAAEIAQWQKSLWKFSSVGHIGKVGGPKAWMEPINPLATKQPVRLKIPASPEATEVTLFLIASDAGDGNENDFVLWEQPHLVAPGRPNLLLRDVRDVSHELAQRRERIFASAGKCLSAAAEADQAQPVGDVAVLAQRHGIEPDILEAWLEFLGLGSGGPVQITSYFTSTLPKPSTYDFIKGWGSNDTPLLVANSSDQHVRIPGNMKPHSVAVHPSPKLQTAVGWRSPAAATLRVEASVTHAHPECGNGVTWSLELRRGATRQRLAAGTAQGGNEVKVGPFEHLAVQPGDLVSLLIGPRDANHSCDLTGVDLTFVTDGDTPRRWNLADDVSPDVLAGNPHVDRFGNEAVWHFYTEPDDGGRTTGPVIPAGSILARWQSESNLEKKHALAAAVQTLLTSGPPLVQDSPDAALYRQLASLGGPMFSGERARRARAPSLAAPAIPKAPPGSAGSPWGLDAALFGRHPDGRSIDVASLCVRAPSVIEIRLPADLVRGCELVTTGGLDPVTGAEGSVQLQVLTSKPRTESGLLPSSTAVTNRAGVWTDNNQAVSHSRPIVVTESSQARRRFEGAFDDFRRWFPAALCYTKIVPVDEVVTLTLFHREDGQLARLMLEDAEQARLDRLWDELHYVSHDALTLVDAFAQLMEYATQDADPKVFEPLRKPINDQATAFRQRLIRTEPAHLEAVLEFAERAYRRPLTDSEQVGVHGLYRELREQKVPHDEAIRLTLARVLVAPAFLYRAESPGPGAVPGPVTDWELASRLSYFLWSSLPDTTLRDLAATGRLRDPDTLAGQARRMLGDARARRLALEFACQWLHIRNFDSLEEKSERHFPTFRVLRDDMHEESIRFFTHLFQHDGSVLDLLDADHTFLNEALAKYYGIPGVTGGEWRRVDGVKRFARGGVLAQATTLATQSGASRTSPILRGNWVAEALLGDKLPRPPKDVPRLPEDEATEKLTVRQLTEKHSTDPRCSSCHVRIDPFGFALEGFDAIGRHRERDLADRPIDTRGKLMDGAEIEGLDGLRHYLLTIRRDDFVRQFCRKLLGYALGRAVQLSDEPLLAEMQSELKAKDYRVSVAFEAIVRSRQFLDIRGKEMTDGE